MQEQEVAPTVDMATLNFLFSQPLTFPDPAYSTSFIDNRSNNDNTASDGLLSTAHNSEQTYLGNHSNNNNSNSNSQNSNNNINNCNSVIASGSMDPLPFAFWAMFKDIPFDTPTLT